MLNFESYDSGEVLVFTVEESGYQVGERQSSNREWLYNVVSNRPAPLFALDLSEITYLSSADFGILISLKRRVDARKGQLVLFQVSSYVVDTLNTMRLGSFFTIAPDLGAALSTLEG